MNKSIFHPNYDEFRRNLMAARKTSGITQFRLAKKLGKPQSFVSKYERGERRLDVHEFFEVAEALNIDAFKLLKSVYGAGKAKKGGLVKIIHVETLVSMGRFAQSKDWAKIRKAIHFAIRSVDWPPGSGKFTIYPESGKKRGMGNGVKPIKLGLMSELRRQSWTLEMPLDIATVDRPGRLDAVLSTEYGRVALEWETGNISSSHRALNKMALALIKGVLIAGILVVPTRELYQYLTDRVGNWGELVPYLDLWRMIPYKKGILEIVVVEHDAVSKSVRRIPKGTDGRAVE